MTRSVLADMIVQADLNPESRSLNIAQAVFMMCWEWRMAALADRDSGQRKHSSYTASQYRWQ